jgi:hypothetical protein
VKVLPRAFGLGWRTPIAQKFRAREMNTCGKISNVNNATNDIDSAIYFFYHLYTRLICCFVFMLFAYIDPGLGSLIWQSTVAGVVGFLFYLKKSRRWIVNVFRKMFRRGQKAPGISIAVPPPKVEVEINPK